MRLCKQQASLLRDQIAMVSEVTLPWHSALAPCKGGETGGGGGGGGGRGGVPGGGKKTQERSHRACHWMAYD